MSFYVQEISDAIRDLLDGVALTFAPKLVMIGGLEYYPENADITLDLPAVFIETSSVESEAFDVGASALTQVYQSRIAVLGTWSAGDVVHSQKTAYAKEVWNLLVTSGIDYGASIAGLQIEHALPVKAEMSPPEEIAVTQRGLLNVFAVAIESELRGIAVL